MTPLQEKYPKHFVPETMKPIYQIIGHLTIEQGQQIVGTLILRHRFAPLESDFKDALHELFRPRMFIKPEEEKYEKVFTEEEVKENFNLLRRIVNKQVGSEEIETTIEALRTAIESKRIK